MSLDNILRSIGKNLIPYPYTGTSSTMFGVTFTVNSDGSVTANGTATANAVFELEYDATMFTLPVGNYFLSGCPSGGSTKSYFMAAANGAGISYDKFQRDFGNGVSVPSKGEKWKITIRIISGYTADNLVFKPQIELGSTATSYEPYHQGPESIKIGDKEVLKVSYGSRNLIPYPFTFESITSYGITFTDNKNGTITLNGQLSDNTTPATYILFNNTNINKLGLKPNIDYYLSCSDSSLIVSLRTVKTDGTNKFYSYGNIKFSSEETPDRLFLQVKKDDTRTFENTVISIQLELGNKVTDYVPYFNTVVWTKKA